MSTKLVLHLHDYVPVAECPPARRQQIYPLARHSASSISVFSFCPHTADSTVVAAFNGPARGPPPSGGRMRRRHASRSKGGGGGGPGASRTISVRGGDRAPECDPPHTAPPVSARGYTAGMKARLVPVGWRRPNRQGAPFLLRLAKRRRARRWHEFRMRVRARTAGLAWRTPRLARLAAHQ